MPHSRSASLLSTHVLLLQVAHCSSCLSSPCSIASEVVLLALQWQDKVVPVNSSQALSSLLEEVFGAEGSPARQKAVVRDHANCHFKPIEPACTTFAFLAVCLPVLDVSRMHVLKLPELLLVKRPGRSVPEG